MYPHSPQDTNSLCNGKMKPNNLKPFGKTSLEMLLPGEVI